MYLDTYYCPQLTSYCPALHCKSIEMEKTDKSQKLRVYNNLIISLQKQADTLQSLFREKHEFNAFNSYASVKYYRKKPYDMYIGIKNNGKIKRAMKTHRVCSTFGVLQLVKRRAWLTPNRVKNVCKDNVNSVTVTGPNRHTVSGRKDMI